MLLRTIYQCVRSNLGALMVRISCSGHCNFAGGFVNILVMAMAMRAECNACYDALVSQQQEQY